MFVFQPLWFLFDGDELCFVIVYEFGIEAHAEFQSGNNLTDKYLLWMKPKTLKALLQTELLSVVCIKYYHSLNCFFFAFYSLPRLQKICIQLEMHAYGGKPNLSATKPHLMKAFLQYTANKVDIQFHLIFDLSSLLGVCWWNWDHGGSPWPQPTDTVHGQSLLGGGWEEQWAPARNWDHTYVFSLWLFKLFIGWHNWWISNIGRRCDLSTLIDLGPGKL